MVEMPLAPAMTAEGIRIWSGNVPPDGFHLQKTERGRGKEARNDRRLVSRKIPPVCSKYA